ncbi:MAG: recombinase family protein [Candidatus Obscuribacterales bacterium]|nr:recombinase family protein [Candidatus Obscuribacterales bacterium]
MPKRTKTPALAETLELNPVLLLIGYIRVSTEQQSEGCSLDEQARRITEYCKEKGYNLLCIFKDTASGDSIKERPGFLEAFRMIMRDQADGLVVWSGDRFSRNLFDSMAITRAFSKKRKRLLAVSEQINLADKNGRLVFNMKQAVAQYIREDIVERLYDLRIAKADKGGWIGHRPPYGYIVVAHQLVEDPEEQMILRLMRRLKKWVKDTGLREDGTKRSGVKTGTMSYAAIAAYLNKRAETDPRFAPKTTKSLQRPRNRPYSPKRTQTWRPCVVRSILLGVCHLHEPVVCLENPPDQFTHKSQAS